MLVVDSRRVSLDTLHGRCGAAAVLLDVTSRGADPWVRCSPFYPHGEIPVPFSPGISSQTVEGIWQGLKVFERAGVDPRKFTITTMHNLKRSTRTLGKVLGHREGVRGERLLPYVEARLAIYLPAYGWVLEHCVADLLDELHIMAREQTVVLLDYTTNGDVHDASRPLSHAWLLKHRVEGTWPV